MSTRRTDAVSAAFARWPEHTGRLWRLFDCLVGGVAAAVAFRLSLPLLNGAAHSLQMLASTGRVFVMLFAWLFFWFLDDRSNTAGRLLDP